MTRSLPFLAVVLAGCSAPALPDPPARPLMDRTTAGQDRCILARSHDRPFVIEWDATDLASFEAKAARDVVFVRYEGCRMAVVYGCSDDGLPGRYGTYAPPRFTSGTLEQVSIKDEGELYAQLPLGAASLAGRVQAGQSLQMRYYVTGVAMATRDSVYRGDLAGNPRCAGATHWVWAYNLGAFSLDAAEHAEAKAGLSGARSEAGGGAARSAESIKRGGDLESCKTQDQRACRTPIRLALRTIEEGDRPVLAATPPPSPPVSPGASTAATARTLRASAEAKKAARDGVACLADLDQAARLDPAPANPRVEGQLRAACEMLAGRCDAGRSRVRAALAAQDADRKRSDESLDEEAHRAAAEWCPDGQGTTAEQIARAVRRVFDGWRTDTPKVDVVAKEARRALDLLPRLDPRTHYEKRVRDDALSELDWMPRFLAEHDRCADAWTIHEGLFAITHPRATYKAVPNWETYEGEVAGRFADLQHARCHVDAPGSRRDRIDRAAREMSAHAGRKEELACVERGQHMLDLLDGDPKAMRDLDVARLIDAAGCAARAGRCADRERLAAAADRYARAWTARMRAGDPAFTLRYAPAPACAAR
ncbi:MAG: hypothetical protein QM820_38060 [Minicystis sp.]